jgi:hypothetical protein
VVPCNWRNSGPILLASDNATAAWWRLVGSTCVFDVPIS